MRLGLGLGVDKVNFIGGLDPATTAFITATGITDPTIITAVNNFVVGAKGTTLYAKLKAVYPLVGGTATTHKYNLINPVDSDAAFRLAFSGGWTHDANGATPNGTNAYADTFLIQSTNLAIDYAAFGIYYNIDDSTPVNTSFEGGNGTSTRFMGGYMNFTTTGFVPYISDNNDSYGSPAYTKWNGLKLASRIASTHVQILNGGSYTNYARVSTLASDKKFYFGARNNNGTPSNYVAKRRSFMFLSDGLTQTEMTNLETLVQAMQTTLGRQVSY